MFKPESAFALAVLLLCVYNVGVIAVAVARGSDLAAESTPFIRKLSDPAHKILVVGDSTAVGTGAAAPEHSIAGRIAADFPRTTVLNFAEDGVLTGAIPGQIKQVPRGPYDLVLVQVGGNDALRLTGSRELQRAIEKSLDAAVALSPRVLLVSVGDLGEARAAPWPLSLLLSYRSRLVRDVFADAARRRNVEFLDLLALSEEGNPFEDNSERYYARDGLHPSSAGYAVWYENLLSAVPLAQWLESAAPAK
ncbi:SGNH/GDSL hydrolase family protein [Congregibacter sp.]|uniref:SGNH/GDSL hydrolase family protein n=1 Tax=Congregibacter sp. TaxID=2744308 RepID=UPI003F6D26D0